METKPWWQSQTIIANILLTVTAIARATGIITDDAATAIVAEVPDLITGVVAGFLGLWGLYGRVMATKAITLTRK